MEFAGIRWVGVTAGNGDKLLSSLAFVAAAVVAARASLAGGRGAAKGGPFHDAEMEVAGIGIASATYDIVGLPPVTLGRGRIGSDGAGA